jgi:hypothetical protein
MNYFKNKYQKLQVVILTTLLVPASMLMPGSAPAFSSDVGVVSINSPPDTVPPGPVTISATIGNFGDSDQADVLVNCSVYNEFSFTEGFEGTFPPDGWTIRNYNGTGTWLQESYASNDSYDPPGTGAYYAEADDYDNTAVYDVGLFTPPLNLDGYDTVTLTFERNFQVFSIHGIASVNVYSGGTNPYNLQEQLLNLTTDDPYNGVHTELTFNPSIYDSPAEVYIEFYYTDENYTRAYKFCIDDVSVHALGDPDPLYTAETTVSIPAHDNSYAEFQPPWDAPPGNFSIVVTTLLPDDENPANDQLSKPVLVAAENDIGVVSIDAPTGIQRPGDHVVQATVKNFGSHDQAGVPVQCNIYDESDILIFTADTTVDVLSFETESVEFSPAWSIADEGNYTIDVATWLPGDAFPGNDAKESVVTIQPFTDVGVASINNPPLFPPGSTTISATLINLGDEDQDHVVVSCKVIEGTSFLFFEEDFTSLQSGWYQEGGAEWQMTHTNHAGGVLPEVYLIGSRILGDYSYLGYASINTAGALSLGIEFKTYIDHALGTFSRRVHARASSSESWVEVSDITITEDMGPQTERYDISALIGPETQFIFEFQGPKNNINAWYIDDVKITGVLPGFRDIVYEDEETVSVPVSSTTLVEFLPPWNASLGSYVVTVTVHLDSDENPQNDNLEKHVQIIWEDDTGVLSIDSPSGIQRPGDYPVQATVKNFGCIDQNDVPVHCEIYDATDALVFTSDTIVDIPVLEIRSVEFTPPWSATTEGTYRINVTTSLPGDAEPGNDAAESLVYIVPYTDVAPTSINSPVGVISSGPAVVSATMTNFGGTDQNDVSVHCEINEGYAGNLLEEAFSGFFPPAGWEQQEAGEWTKSDSNDGGGTAPEACLYWEDVKGLNAYLDSIPVDTTGASHLALRFTHAVYHIQQSFDCRVYTRASGADVWTDVTPWPNPVTGNIDPQMVTRDISLDIGPATQVRFYWEGLYGSFMDGWYIDDVVVYGTGDAGPVIYENDELVNIPVDSPVEVTFVPAWVALEGDYIISVATQLPFDENPDNDLISSPVHVRSELDVGVIDIGDPIGIERPGTHEVHAAVRNFGVSQLVPLRCSIYNETDDLVYQDDEEIFVQGLKTQYVKFYPGWQVPDEATYHIHVTTLLPGDTNSSNDAFETFVVIQEYTDLAPVKINDPPHGIYKGDHTIHATFANLGITDKLVPVECSIYTAKPPSTLVYSTSTTVFIQANATADVTFDPPWTATDLRRYRIKVYTRYPSDEDPGNDKKVKNVVVVPGPDAGAFSINSPTGDILPGDHVIRAGINNFGGMEDTIPVVCTIYNKTDDPVYAASANITIRRKSAENVEFSPPWTVATAGSYRVHVTTVMPDDENPGNDAVETQVTVVHYIDAGVEAIIEPPAEITEGNITVKATIANLGDKAQTVPVYCEIVEGVNGAFFHEDFTENFPPPGWTQEEQGEWRQSNSKNAGGAIPEADLNGENIQGEIAWLNSPPLNTAWASALTLKFKHAIELYQGRYFICKVVTRAYPEDTLTDVTPWRNPVPDDIDQETHTIDISHDIGSGTQVGFIWFVEVNTFLEHWYLDDVELMGKPIRRDQIVYESSETVHIELLSSADVDFTPPWAALPGIYTITVFAMLDGDQDDRNNAFRKIITVYERGSKSLPW